MEAMLFPGLETANNTHTVVWDSVLLWHVCGGGAGRGGGERMDILKKQFKNCLLL